MDERDEHWYKNMQMIEKSIMGQKGQKVCAETEKFQDFKKVG